MRDSYNDTATKVLALKNHRDPPVRRMVITLIPTLAAYDRQTFTEYLIHPAIAYLIATLEKPQERSFGKSYQPAASIPVAQHYS